jgi:hypothetical protein
MNRAQFSISLIGISAAGCSGGGGSPSTLPRSAVAAPVAQSFTVNGVAGTSTVTGTTLGGTMTDGTSFSGNMNGSVFTYNVKLPSGQVVNASITDNGDGSATYRDAVNPMQQLTAKAIADNVARRGTEDVCDGCGFFGSAFDVAALVLLAIGLVPFSIAAAIIGAALGSYPVFARGWAPPHK